MTVPAVTLWALVGSSSSGLLLVFGNSDENSTDRDFKRLFSLSFLFYPKVIVCICFILFSSPSPVYM